LHEPSKATNNAPYTVPDEYVVSGNGEGSFPPRFSLPQHKNFRIDGKTSSQDTSSLRISTAVLAAQTPSSSSSAPPAPSKKAQRRRLVLGGRVFRVNIRSFFPNADLSQRRFSIVEAALLLILALLTSRGLGVIRQLIFNTLFGAGPAATAYYAAANLPDTLFDLIAGGALSSAFIPVFFSYEKNLGAREAWRLASLVFNVLLVTMTLLIIIGEFTAPVIVTKLLVPGYSPSEQAFTTTLVRILMLHPLILGIGTIATAILNSRRQFLLPAVAIAVYNFGLIAGLLVTMAVPRIGIYGPTFGLLVAAALQIVVQVPGVLKQGAQYFFVWNLRHPGLHEILRMLIPNALAVGVASLGLLVDTSFASYLPDLASLAAIRNAQLLYALPVALLSQAVGMALLPHLTLQAATQRFFRMRQTALKIMGAAIALTAPGAVLLVIFGHLIIRLIFQHGAFNAHDASLTYLALLGYAAGIPGITSGVLIANGFIAMKDTRTPLFMNTFALLTRYGIVALLFHTLSGTWQLLSIPLGLSISATAEAILMCLFLLMRLRTKVRDDKGIQRLRHRQAALRGASQ
jgi:putative peptidoglycan lipid II flippase